MSEAKEKVLGNQPGFIPCIKSKWLPKDKIILVSKERNSVLGWKITAIIDLSETFENGAGI